MYSSQQFLHEKVYEVCVPLIFARIINLRQLTLTAISPLLFSFVDRLQVPEIYELLLSCQPEFP